MIAAIVIRGLIGSRSDVRDTLTMLKLHDKHNLVLVEDRPEIRGMLRKAKDFIAYGEVTEATAKKLQEMMVEDRVRMHPPRGGLRSIKRPYNGGGDLGDRGEAMEELVQRMMP